MVDMPNSPGSQHCNLVPMFCPDDVSRCPTELEMHPLTLLLYLQSKRTSSDMSGGLSVPAFQVTQKILDAVETEIQELKREKESYMTTLGKESELSASISRIAVDMRICTHRWLILRQHESVECWVFEDFMTVRCSGIWNACDGGRTCTAFECLTESVTSAASQSVLSAASILRLDPCLSGARVHGCKFYLVLFSLHAPFRCFVQVARHMTAQSHCFC